MHLRFLPGPMLVAALLSIAGCASPSARIPLAQGDSPPVPEAVEAIGAGSGGRIRLDTRCAVDADCVVKNIGNCCGYFPACLNRDSPTDPEGELARCAESGELAVCGHPMIYGCRCEQGICRPDPAAGFEGSD